MELGRQSGTFKYEIKLYQEDLSVTRAKEQQMVNELEGDGFYDVDFDWDVDKREEDGEEVCYATLSLGYEEGVHVELGTNDYDEDNDAVIDPEPDTIMDPVDPDDVNWEVKNILSKYGITDVYTITCWVDSVETVIDRIREREAAVVLYGDSEDEDI